VNHFIFIFLSNRYSFVWNANKLMELTQLTNAIPAPISTPTVFNVFPTLLDALFALSVMELIHLGNVRPACLSIHTVINAFLTPVDAPSAYKALS
jgi:hypothetical protein